MRPRRSAKSTADVVDWREIAASLDAHGYATTPLLAEKSAARSPHSTRRRRAFAAA